jgi:hypothetical protein
MSTGRRGTADAPAGATEFGPPIPKTAAPAVAPDKKRRRSIVVFTAAAGSSIRVVGWLIRAGECAFSQRTREEICPLETSLDTAALVRLFRRRHMNLNGTTLASLLAHTSVVVVSVVSVSASVVTTAPRGF